MKEKEKKEGVQESLGIMCLGENEYSTMGREDNRGKEQIKFFQWD